MDVRKSIKLLTSNTEKPALELFSNAGFYVDIFNESFFYIFRLLCLVFLNFQRFHLRFGLFGLHNISSYPSSSSSNGFNTFSIQIKYEQTITKLNYYKFFPKGLYQFYFFISCASFPHKTYCLYYTK